MKKNKHELLDSLAKIAGVGLILLLWSIVTPETAFLWTVFIIFAIFKLDERILGGIAIFFLICIPILLALNNEVKAEQLAIYVFFLLCMVVTLQMFELIRNRGKTMDQLQTPGKYDFVKKIYKRKRPKVDQIVKE